MTRSKKTFMDNLQNPAELFISVPKEETSKDLEKETDEAPDGYHVNPLYIENKSKRLQLLIKPSTLEKLKAKAQEEGTSVNNLVNTILEEALREE